MVVALSIVSVVLAPAVVLVVAYHLVGIWYHAFDRQRLSAHPLGRPLAL